MKDGLRLFNRWRPSLIKRIKGDVQAFLDFTKYMWPVERERFEVQRWAATLIARPDIRLLYSLLLVTKTQVIGKDTFGRILGALVGSHNTSNPDAQLVIDSPFHDHLVDKMLVIVSEIYEGHGWRAYNKLKSHIVALKLDVNSKGIPVYPTDLHTAFLFCSKANNCLKIENSDRRLLIPKTTETPWPEAKFTAFYDWLFVEGGLGIVLDWAHTFGNYVRAGEIAPQRQN